jgi:alanyl-tRNA synthetase
MKITAVRAEEIIPDRSLWIRMTVPGNDQMRKIYETDSYTKEYDTVITGSGALEDGRCFVELKDTIFFPEEGGQKADTGTLTAVDTGLTVRLTDGMIVRGAAGAEDTVRYIVSEPLEPGTGVRCTLDWESRYDRMQNHSGEHILTGVIHNRYGFDNVGFHLSDTGFVTLDLNGVISYEQVIEAESEANRAVYANLPIRDSYPSANELKDIEYRSKIDIEGQVRLISIGGTSYSDSLDVCACCAPHVARTGEIGIIKVISVINWKGGIRISMLCGRRALDFINREHNLLTDTARLLSTEADNVPAMTEQHRKEISELKYRLNEVLKQTVIDRIRNSDNDEQRLIFVAHDYPDDIMKDIYNELTDKYDGFTGVFAGDDEHGYRYSAGSKTRDSRELAAGLRESFGAKGGGSPQMIRGRVDASREDLIKYFRGL